jgi:hypothetical protein
MSEFSDKVSAIKESMKDHVFSPSLDEDNGDVTVIESDDSFNDSPDTGESQNVSESAPRKSNFRSRGDKNKLKSRLDQTTYEKNLYLAQNRELMARLQDQERILAENRYKAAQNEQQRDAYYEDNLVTKEQSILNALKVAKEEGDIDKEVNLSHELSKIAAEKSTYDLYKNQISPQQQMQQEQPYYNDYDIVNAPPIDPYIPYQEDEPENEHLENWLENNPWADPNSHNFSPRLRAEINDIASEFDRMLEYDGSAHMIGTPDYFNSLDTIMRERYSIDDNRQQPRSSGGRQPQYSGGSQHVAPVSRNGGSMADQYMSNNRNRTRQSVPLTEAEYNIARNLQIKLPNGRMATPEEAIKRYADAKRMDTPGSGMHPHRIIID